MEVTDDLVLHVAKLSRLAISQREAQELKNHFRKVLGYVADLEAVDTRDIDPGVFALEASNVYRADEAGPSISNEAALACAPQAHPPYFLVPRIVGGPDAEDPSRGGEA